MGIIKWFRREKIRRGARKEIKQARESAPGTRQGQRALARKIEKIRARDEQGNRQAPLRAAVFLLAKNGKVPPFAIKRRAKNSPRSKGA